jgi:hypothetical protein
MDLRKMKWSYNEDVVLRRLVGEHGDNNWAIIAGIIPNRSSKQCRERWAFHLKPKIKDSVWTREEEEILRKEYKKLGPQWAQIACYLPGKNRGQIKDHFAILLKRDAKIQQQEEQRSSIVSENHFELSIPTVVASLAPSAYTKFFALSTPAVVVSFPPTAPQIPTAPDTAFGYTPPNDSDSDDSIYRREENYSNLRDADSDFETEELTRNYDYIPDLS